MRLLAYEGGRGAVVVRRALLVFVINGGKAGGTTEAEAGPLCAVGDISPGDWLFAVEDNGAGDGDISVAIFLARSRQVRQKRGGLWL